MTRQEIIDNVGSAVTLNGRGDLGFEPGLRRIIRSKCKLAIVKLTRGGLAYLTPSGGKGCVLVPPKNVDLAEGGHPCT